MPRSAYKEDPRTFFRTFRFTAAEVTRLESRARARRQGVSAYVRAMLFGQDDAGLAAGPGTPTAAEQDYPVRAGRRANAAERSLTNQLRKVGTNLNQIAHRMNEQRIPPPRELTRLLDEIRDLVRQAREA